MIRHVVVLRWHETTPADHAATVTRALRALPDRIPTIRAYTPGADLLLGDGRWDYAVVADFDDLAGYQAYAEDPDHLAVIAEHIAPHVAQRAAVQLEV